MGCVYLVAGVGYDIHKIGSSQDITKRLRYFRTNLPFQVELIHKIETTAPAKLERELHKKFSDKRVNGEWFRLDQADIELFKAYQ